MCVLVQALFVRANSDIAARAIPTMETIYNLRNPPWTIPITFAAFLYKNLHFEVIHVDSMYAHGGQDYNMSSKSIVKNLLHSTLKT